MIQGLASKKLSWKPKLRLPIGFILYWTKESGWGQLLPLEGNYT